MTALDYLKDGLLAGGKLREDLAQPARQLAAAWIDAGVDASRIEVLAEHLARWAAGFTDGTVTAEQVPPAVAFLDLPEEVTRFFAAAIHKAAGSLELAAIAVHLVDVAEAMALKIFVPELPALSAKADRSGDAARKVGLARHLKG